jgi:signal transduction histidine kinase
MDIRILHIEDSAADAWLLSRTLKDDGWGVEATVVTSLPDLLKQIDGPWDIVLADFGLPGFSTTEALGLVREKHPDLPFVVVSGQIGEENAVTLMKAGADDYVSKNYLQRLSPILRRLMEDRRIKEEQRIQRQKNQELENRFRHFFSQNLSGMAMLTTEGEIQEINQALVDLMGLDPLHLPSFWSLFVSSEQALLVRTQLETKESYGPEVVEMLRSDGAHTFLLSTYQLPGTAPLIWANFIDHTEQLSLQEQIFQIKKLESLGQLAGGIAHEFNNILSIIQGHLGLLELDHPPGSPAAPRIEVIKRAASRGASIVNQLLVLARRRPIKKENLRIEELLTDTARLVEDIFPENLVLRVDVSPGLPGILGDRDQLSQAFLNLVINARDSMPDGGTITLAARLFQDGGTSMIRVEVSDEGMGVPPGLVDKIFDPFFTTKAEGKGTGLGLSLVAKVAESHQGRIGVEPRTPRGTIFFILFPAALSFEEDSSASLLQPGRPHQSISLLLVESEADVLTFEKQILENQGYRVAGCLTAAEAWPLLQDDSQAFALVITDLGLPGLKGEDFCRLVRTLPSAPCLVVQSGNFDPGVQERLEALGIRDFLLKPFTATELLKTLQTVLDRIEKRKSTQKGP